MRNLLAIFIVFVVLPSFAANAAVEKEKPSPVDVMQGMYAEQFKEFPPARKCAPEDAKGLWKQVGTYEAGSKTEAELTQEKGPRYLVFGAYNMLVWTRAKAPLSRESLDAAVRQTAVQYIVTAAGVLYIYEQQSLTETWLCFVSTAATNKYAIGSLILAHPVEKDKSLTAVIYAPL